jgi:anti-anti-sigma factor
MSSGNSPFRSQLPILHPAFQGPVAQPFTAAAEHSALFSCSITRGHGRVELGIIGEIDRTCAGQFRNQLLTLAKEHPSSIAIDMKQVALPDEAAVAVLVETWRFAQEHGIELVVTSPSPGVTRTFEVAPTGQLLTLRT